MASPADNAMLQIAKALTALLDHQRRIAETHDLGDSGTHDVLSEEWAEIAAPILAETLPSGWLRRAQVVAVNVLQLMEAHDPAESVRSDWEVVTIWYENLSHQFSDYLDDSDDRYLEVDMNLEGYAPAFIRYDKLAAGIHPDATARMITAVSHVRAYSLQAGYAVTDLELEWLRALSTGERGLDVGIRFGISERDFYRAQQQLWAKLGVANRSEAFVRASELGWI
jgi:DNA-binding CsgD family transcriptional regulator